MSQLNLPLMFERLGEGQLVALHAVDGFVAGVEARGDRPLHYGPLFQKLMNSLVAEIPADEGLDTLAHAWRPLSEVIARVVDRVIAEPDFTKDLDDDCSFCITQPVGDLRALISGRIMLNAALGRLNLQARPPNPGPVAKPAEHGAPPVAAAEIAPSAQHLEAAVQLEAIREALAPLGPWLVYMRDREESSIYWNKYDSGVLDSYAELLVGDLRNLMRAAGMFTDEMQVPSVPPDPRGPDAKPVEAPNPPPAEHDADALQATAPPSGLQAPAAEAAPQPSAATPVVAEPCPMGDPGCCFPERGDHHICLRPF